VKQLMQQLLLELTSNKKAILTRQEGHGINCSPIRNDIRPNRGSKEKKSRSHKEGKEN
jgi:hypothetical protein